MPLPIPFRKLLPATVTPAGTTAIVAEDAPDREIRLGAAVVVLFFGGFLGWASIARMDAAASASGEVTVYGHRQSVQHRDGGVVGALKVKEGQHVQAGQVLVELAAPEVRAQERALASQVISLEAQRARLLAEQASQPSFAEPPEFATLSPEDRAEADKAMRVQQSEFHARSASLSAQKGVMAQRASELSQQIEGYKRQIEAADRQTQLLGDELKGVQSLADRGYAPLSRVRDLQRQQAQIVGNRGQYVATIVQSERQAGEARLQMVQADTGFRQDVSADLRQVESSLNDALPKLSAAREQLARTDIRAPASGAVVGLSVFTVGGVIAPGQKVLDIVPDRAPLLITARVTPNDADDVRVGQEAELKFTGLHQRGLPTLRGEVTKMSADSFTDDKTGAPYFVAEVSVPMAQMRELERVRGGALKPGLPVQVLIPLRKRTALQYLIEPLGDALWRSFREH